MWNSSCRLGETEKALSHYKQSGPITDSKDIAQAQALQKNLNRCIEARKLEEWSRLLKETERTVSSGADSAPQVSNFEPFFLLSFLLIQWKRTIVPVQLYLLHVAIKLILKQVTSVLHLGFRYASRGTTEAPQAPRSLHGLPKETEFFCWILCQVIWSDYRILSLSDWGTGLHGCRQVGKSISFGMLGSCILNYWCQMCLYASNNLRNRRITLYSQNFH